MRTDAHVLREPQSPSTLQASRTNWELHSDLILINLERNWEETRMRKYDISSILRFLQN